MRPEVAAAHNLLGALLCDHERDYEGAVKSFREAIRLQPNNAVAHYNLGTALRQQQKWADAEIEFREANRIRPEDLSTYIQLTLVLRKQNKWEQAEATCRNALRVKSGDARAHHSLGVTLKEQRKFGPAKAAFQKAIRLNPKSADSHSRLSTSANTRETTQARPQHFEKRFDYSQLLPWPISTSAGFWACKANTTTRLPVIGRQWNWNQITSRRT